MIGGLVWQLVTDSFAGNLLLNQSNYLKMSPRAKRGV